MRTPLNPTAVYHRAHASKETALALFHLLHAAGLHQAALLVHDQVRITTIEYEAAQAALLAPWELPNPDTITEDEATQYQVLGEVFACCARM
ncbi:hypothetical protein HER32_11835 [Hymenobacter sp. BT18]|uniref:hypothetical protein n=1 Tax=Hymenobacter sp. BT18 TaxID=2835648 RepID=UPI00143EE53B|nr:hypothetical protein [Hymenobacter sp. BT18]QIX61832.1 hypothetical protein HER32_11835 [Hymenobacter sp. BT18]